MNRQEAVLDFDAPPAAAGLRKTTQAFGGMDHQFASAECSSDQLDDVLAQLQVAASGRQGRAHAQKLTVFCGQTDGLAEAARRIGRESGWSECAMELVRQAPASGALLGLQLWRIVAPPAHVGDVDWAFRALRPSLPGAGYSERFTRDFHAALEMLREDGFGPMTLARTWLYIGDINGHDAQGDIYQQINAARREAFSRLEQAILPRENFGYPASTGIGQLGGAFCLGALACRTRGQYRMVSLENRQQTSAFSYPRSESEVPPLFSRAVAVLDGASALVMVSGTASILGAQSVHLGDVVRQTVQTLDNIETLLQRELLAQYECRPVVEGLQSVTSCVVYIKHAQHYAAVKAVCDQRLPRGVVVNFNLADVCRPELLVEIEAVAVLGQPDDHAVVE